MRITRGAVAIALIPLTVSGCRGGGDSGTAARSSSSTNSTGSSSSSSAAPDRASSTTTGAAPAGATGFAEGIKASVKSVSKVVTITEDNDPNDKIGRPDDYVSTATLYDNGALCTELGADCGATIEVWPDEASASARSKFILDTLKNADGVVGEEYHCQRGPALLRVSGTLKPSVAKQCKAPFEK